LQCERLSGELTGAMHGRVGDPRFIGLAVRRRWESHGEHRRTGRRHDELTRSSGDGNALRVRVAEDVQRRSIVRERMMKRRCPDAQHDRCGARRDRDGRGDRDPGRAARTQRDDVLAFVVGRLEDAPAQRRRRRRPFDGEREGAGGASQPVQLAPAGAAFGEMGFEALEIVARQRIEGIEG